MKTKECFVCKGIEPDNIFSHRCEKHNVCLSCGTKRKDLKETPWGKRGGFICKPCEQKRIQEKIKTFQDENACEDEFYDDDIICPFCGEKHECDGEDGAFYSEGDHKFSCADCDNVFNVNTYISYSYTTSKIKNIGE